MRKVGLQKLRTRLGHYARLARAGHEIQVTRRGEVVAELVPPRRATASSEARKGLLALARQGLVRLGLPNDPRVYRRMPPLRKPLKPGELQRLIDEERGER